MNAREIVSAITAMSHPIMHAVEADNRLEVQKYLDSSPELVHYADPVSFDEPLHLAAWQNRVELVNLLLDRGANIDAKGSNGRSPLHCAVAALHPAVVRILIHRGASPNLIDAHGHAPLYAVTIDQSSAASEILGVLLQSGAILDLHSAIRLKQSGIVAAYLKAGQGANAAGNAELLCDAVLVQSPEIVGLLLAQGYPVEPTGYDRESPLFISVSASFADAGITELLLSHGADVNRPSPVTGERPLERAKRVGNPKASEILMRYGAL